MIQASSFQPVSNLASSARKTEKTDHPATSFVKNTLQADAAIKSAILKLLHGNPKPQLAFEASFQAEMQQAADMNLQITDENAMHNALCAVIRQNRGQFPAGAFSVKTELPGGGSIETAIPEISVQVLPDSSNEGASATKLSGLLTQSDAHSQVPTNVVIEAYSSNA